MSTKGEGRKRGGDYTREARVGADRGGREGTVRPSKAKRKVQVAPKEKRSGEEEGGIRTVAETERISGKGRGKKRAEQGSIPNVFPGR